MSNNQKPQIEKAATSSSQKCTLSDAELIAKCDEWISKLCKTGGRAWVLSVPVQLNNDPDVLLSTMMNRFKALSLSKEKEEEWIPVSERLPENLETVWVSNGSGWTTLGCLVETNEGWHWAQTNGIIYQEDNKIVSECESEDLDVKFWKPLPSPPNPK